MKPTNPFKYPIESIHLTERGRIEDRRVIATDAANKTRFALWPFVRDLLARNEESGQTEQPTFAAVANSGATTTADVPGSLNNVVDMMGRAEARELTAQEWQLAEAMRATEEAFEEPNHGIAA